MKLSKLESELIRCTKGLPKDVLREILDFAQFIRFKKMNKSTDNLTKELYLLSTSETEHLEEEFKDYKKLYPSE
jgi:hypothetical protein